MENSSPSEDLENGDRTVPVSSTPLAADREDDEEHYTESDSTLLVPISEPKEDDEYLNRQKWLIWKNVVVIGVSFMCLFTAFSVATVLQSSLNAVNGLGTISQSTVYVGQLISSMFIPSLMMEKIGLKWTMVLCQLCFSSYIGAQFYPTFATLIPTAALVGLAAAPLWAAQSTYITQVGIRYTKLIGQESVEPAISRFFGVFFMIMPFSTVWGNIINSLVLSNDSNNATHISDERLSLCGVNFCYDEFANLTANDTDGSPIAPPANQVEMLFGILLGFSILAALILAFLVDSDPQRDENIPKKSGCEMLIATFRHAINPYQILIIPLTMWTGFAPTFASAELTEAFIVCAWGVEHIGYVMICHGLAASLGSFIFGNLVKWTGRIPIVLFGATINLSLISAMLFFWHPDPNHPEMFYIVVALWGLGNAVWNTQLNSFYGVIFEDRKEAGFSNLRLWQSLGFGIAYAYSSYICVNVKLYILVGVLLTGIGGYLSIEIAEIVQKKRIKREE